MRDTAHKAIAIVGVGAVMPDAPDVPTFWSNLRTGKYSITETPADRWDTGAYWDPDPKVPDKTYSKIGGWVRDWTWDPIAWKLPIPPRVSDNMDRTQKWAIMAAREALADYGWPERTFNPERTAVILGNAMAGEHHYQTALRLSFPEYARELESAPSFAELPAELRAEIEREFRAGVGRHMPEINEDTMPGELSNIIAGRIANLFNFNGPNYVVDAACASAMAAIGAAIEGLEEEDYDVVLTGGVDANMSAHTFIKFCKIGALSATGTRPYADGADGFVMGEGSALFVLKRLTDAERDGDKVYAVIRGVGGASDGRGKGITAPNPAGQKLAVERAWENAGLAPATVGLLEGHGTSTRVGDVAEVESLNGVFGRCGLPAGAVPLGSVKSNIGHLKGAAGAAGILKTALALRDKVLPPSLHCDRLNPNIDFAHLPFRVNTELRNWDVPAGTVRRAGVSAFGFGGTNFHVVLEEHVPGSLSGNGRKTIAVSRTNGKGPAAVRAAAEPRVPPRGIFLAGASRPEEVAEKVRAARDAARAGRAPEPAPPRTADLHAPLRLAIDYGDAAELAAKADKVLQALPGSHPGMWRALRSQGIFFQTGNAGPSKVAFLYTGQGSQYLGMLANLRQSEPVVAETFAEADRVMAPILGRPLSSFLYIDAADPEAVQRAEEELRQTAITQPAVLAVDIALTRVLAEHGIAPDLVMGHSLGEYGALVAAGALSFAEALEAVAARGREMTKVSVADTGRMIAVMAPLEEIEQVLASIDGYAVVANINSTAQAVVGGATDAVTRAEEIFRQAGREVRPLPVSHAFHTSIVAPASEPMKQVLARLDLRPPEIPVVSNATGGLYPMGAGAVPEMIDLLGRQIASPVRFVQGLHTLYDEGVRVFVEVGPKRALHGFVEDAFGKQDDVLALFTNHPKTGDVASLNHALCGLYAAGRGNGIERSDRSVRSAEAPVVVTGGAVGLPGPWKVFDDVNVSRLLHGEQAIDVVSLRFRRAMVDKHITRLVKSEEGGARFETIESPAEVIKLAARCGELDLARDFGIPEERLAAWDHTTHLAVGAGLEALRDAGIPLVMRYKTATTGARLPDRWGLPDEMRDDTGVIFASAFPGYDSLIEIMEGQHRDKARRERLAELQSLRARCAPGDPMAVELDRRSHEVEAELARDPYVFDRRFLFRVLSMGHSQFAELIGARGPNTQINAACASTTQAFALAEDWIRAGRCRRVVVVAADDITTDRMLGWWGAGFLASGAAATDELVEDAALPFDRRRHGLIIGMGAAAVVIETPEAAQERGLRPICQVLSVQTANSAFHGSRLDVRHIGEVMEKLVAEAEKRWGIDRKEIAPQTVFVSHETYTPARGGSAQAEVDALRHVFGAQADQVVVANTKGYTGHPMAVGIEDVMAVKSLETGLVPPVPNLREPDPDLGGLNLSAGGAYPVRYALRLGAGFGSQIGMSLLRWIPNPDGMHRPPDALGYAYRIADPAAWRGWLARVSGDPQAEVEVVHRTLRVVDRTSLSRPSPQPVLRVEEPVVVAVPSPPDPLSHPHSLPPGEGEPDRVREKVLAIVAEKTGYPMEMLDLDLDLEADLGIDTVKQAETFAAIRQAWDIPREENLKLRDFPTLGHTIQFVYDRRPDLRPTAPSPSQLPPPPSPAEVRVPAEPANDAVREKVLTLIAGKTGYPIEMLDLDLDLEADLGIDTVKQAEVFAAIRQEYSIPRDENLKLRDFPTLAHTIQFVYDKRPDLRPAAPSPSQLPPPPTPVEVRVEPASDAVKERVLALIAGKTGYPVEMLDLDLDLEADLGIDTVKQAEMFAAIRQEYSIPRDEDLKLRDFPTLAHTIQFVYDRRPDLKPAGCQEQLPPLPVEGGEMGEGGRGGEVGRAEAPATMTLSTVAIPRRVPTPVLRPGLDLCKPTGVTLGPGSRVVVAFDQGGVGKALAGRLAKMGVEVLALEDAPEADDLVALLQAWRSAGPVQGVYWLTALDREQEIAAMDLAAWREAVRRRVKLFSHTLRTLDEDLGRPGSFVVAATRLGGRHGYDETGAVAPLGGAVTGLAKAFQREQPSALVKAVDFGPGRQTAALAGQLIDETLRDPGTVEIGLENGRRWTIGLAEEPLAAGPGLSLTPDTVFVVTGAAGSIVSAILQDLTAAAHGGIFHLLDLAPAPDPADPDLDRFVTDREGLKRDLFERIKARGERATPALVEKELARLERGRAALDALSAIQAAGGRAVWHRLDLRDGEAVRQAIDLARGENGRIDVLIHAGGLEISRRLADKTPAEYDLVFDVKADGWFNLMSAIGDAPLGAAVVFSSIAGRFGNQGQTDYSAANDLLCKEVSAFRHSRPGTLGIALDWTAWGGIGMATRGSIPQIMEAAGIDMLPPEIGVRWVREELSAGTRGEVVVAGRLGFMLQERDATGGLDVSDEALARLHTGVMVGKPVGMGVFSGLEIETTLDPAEQPFLDHHRIDGTPVLPGVMGVEAFAEAASFLFPDLSVLGVEDVEFLAPFKFYRGAARTLTIRVQVRPDGEDLLAECSLLGSRTLPGQTAPQVTEHFRARVRLAPEAPPVMDDTGPSVHVAESPAVHADDIYKVYFHGPAYQVMDEAWKDGDQVEGRMAHDLPPNHRPEAEPTLMEPRLIELCFQTAGIGELGASGRMALPLSVDRVRTLRHPNGEPLFAVTKHPNGDGCVDAWVVDGKGNVYVTLSGYRTVELPGGVTPETLVPLRNAMG
ncbi:MAG TPA: SDR family NAD(P)-dependent oxidoreductase [Thermoanaerobaculia bacterium]|nr:SDR family NAD(P)-dependent oxidoreductase [Thermoanaerobaculia bacterium]